MQIKSWQWVTNPLEIKFKPANKFMKNREVRQETKQSQTRSTYLFS